jgi:predicted SnoaL-like aldol condensation-catalyzing enzyme
MVKYWACSLLIALLDTAGIVGDACAASVYESPKAIVLAFYKVALQEFKPAEAFARFAAPGFIEHSQDSPGGTMASTVEFLNNLIAKSPQPKWEVVRVIAEGELVFLHARYTAAPGAPEICYCGDLPSAQRKADGALGRHQRPT